MKEGNVEKAMFYGNAKFTKSKYEKQSTENKNKND